MVFIENLDHDVLEKILFRLPLGTASSQAKRVCKSWKTILSNRRHNEVGFLFQCRDKETKKFRLYFGEEYDSNKTNYYYSHETLMQMEHCRFSSYIHHQDFPVGSCNGLVCFEKHTEDIYEDFSEPIAVCNPLTGEFILLKDTLSSTLYKCVAFDVSCGFGYCLSTDEYKVVRFYNLKRDFKQHVQVYTIGSNEWRDVETSTSHYFQSPGIFANGVLHWLDAVYTDETYIAAFDLEDEKLRLSRLNQNRAIH